MIKITVSFLIIVHLWLLLYCFGIINEVAVITLLYLTNALLASNIIVQEIYSDISQSDNDNPPIVIEPRNLPFDESKTEMPLKAKKTNLYIQRWRKMFLHKPRQFPLDRLAYLRAKHYACFNGTSFQLRNSQLKQLAKKVDCRPHENYEDDPHPGRLVNDFSAAYVHYKAAFYRQRKATKANRAQITLRAKKSYSITNFFHCFSEGRKISVTPTVDEVLPTPDELKERRPSLWRRISKSLRRREESVSEESAFEENVS